MKSTVTLESKDVRKIIAKCLNIPEEDVIPLRYNFSVANISAAEIERILSDDPKMRGDAAQ